MKHQNTPSPNFDRIARPYRWLEYLTLGRALQNCRTHHIPHLHGQRHALVLGDGDGRFAAQLLRANPAIQVLAVDTSAAMLRLIQKRSEALGPTHAARLHTLRQNALELLPPSSTDLVVAHFFFDCLRQPELDRLTSRLAAQTAPNALWLVSDFRIPPGPMRWPARILVRALYLAFRILTGLRTTSLPNHAAALSAAGLTCVARTHSLAGLLTTELWQRTEYTPAMLPEQRPRTAVPDPLPDPEPASPSLPEPDPGVYHPNPVPPHKNPPSS